MRSWHLAAVALISIPAAQPTIDQQLLDREKERVHFRRTGKGDLTKLYAEDFLGILPTGAVLDLDGAKASKPNPKYSVISTKIDVYSDAAIMSGIQTPDGTHEVRYMSMWAKQSTGWQRAGFHETLVVAAAKADGETALSHAKLSSVTTPVASSRLAQEVLKIDEQYADIDRRQDRASAKRLQTDRFFFVTPFGRIASAPKPANASRPVRTADVRVRTYGEVAVVTGQMQSTDSNGLSPGPLRFTRVWVRQKGQWKLAAEQQTPITS